MGEIGISRHTFYYELTWWEVKSIIRGYNNRHHAGWEQARLVAYQAHYCMGSKETPPTVTEWLKFPWEKEKEIADGNLPDDNEVARLRQMMREENERMEKANEQCEVGG